MEQNLKYGTLAISVLTKLSCFVLNLSKMKFNVDRSGGGGGFYIVCVFASCPAGDFFQILLVPLWSGEFMRVVPVAHCLKHRHLERVHSFHLSTSS